MTPLIEEPATGTSADTAPCGGEADYLVTLRDMRSQASGRGVDRMDKAMAYGVWHTDGTADYVGIFEGTGHGVGGVDQLWDSPTHAWPAGRGCRGSRRRMVD